jgi:hypothetical protein
MTAVACDAHRVHHPRALTVELHHVIPQAWQHFWTPSADAARRLSAGGLWDPRTVPLCPTGHRNIHALIMKMMRAAASTPTALAPTPREARHLARARGAEADIAELALQRWVDAGGDLRALTSAGLWGEA